MQMTDNYIQYAGGYHKNNITDDDIRKAIIDIQSMDDEHGAFWASVITDDENVIEVNKDLSMSALFEGDEKKYQATTWNEVEHLYNLLLRGQIDKIKRIIIR